MQSPTGLKAAIHIFQGYYFRMVLISYTTANGLKAAVGVTTNNL
jgi:hypothetical protein